MQKLIAGLAGLSLAFSSGIVLANNDHNDDSATRTFKGNATDNASIYTQGPTVTTSPYIGIRSAFNASDLIVNLSSMNEDLRFLEEQLKLAKRVENQHLPYLDHPIIELSGDVVGQAYWAQSYHGVSRDDVNLTNARFDVFSHASDWAMAYISLNFDNAGVDELLQGSGFRLGNSKIFLARAFLTIGNLEVSPVYFTLGQMYVPFGRYATSAVTTPLTVALAQTNARAALLGISYEGFYGSAYGFRGDSDVDSIGINQWGANAGYRYSCDDVSLELGAGYLANIADSSGMQLTGHFDRDDFRGFGINHETEELIHRVPAYDAHGEFGYKSFGLNAEYIATTRHFAAENLNINGRGAKPSALHVEGNYRFELGEFPSAVALAYDHSRDALALNLPEDSYIATFNISVWKNTIQSLEYRHDENYSGHNTSGGTVVSETPVIIANGPHGGGHRNLMLAQIGVYF
jgi:hypothetical protein